MRKSSGSKTMVNFKVDFSGITREFLRMQTVINRDLPKELEKRDTDDRLLDNVLRRLSERYPFAIHVPVGRLEYLKTVLGYKKSVNTRKSSGGFSNKGGIIGRQTIVNIGHVKTLDMYTKISKLDRGGTQMRHVAPFAGNPLKNNRGNAASKHSLWRLLEFPRKSRYTIRPSKKKSISFTTKRSGFAQFHHKRSAIWESSELSSGKHAYFLLDAQRELYKEDQVLLRIAVEDSVRFLIRTKTRFHK